VRQRKIKHKLGSTKPASQLFMFSNSLSENIDTYFSGNIVIEVELSTYDFKYHEEAKQAVDFMHLHCRLFSLKRFKYLTVVLNYKPEGVTLAYFTGIYSYMVAVHKKEGYEQLKLMHMLLKNHELLSTSMSNLVIDLEDILRLSKMDPSNLSDFKANALKKQAFYLKMSLQNLFMNHFLKKFESHFLPSFKR
jgi:hypothetical protein